MPIWRQRRLRYLKCIGILLTPRMGWSVFFLVARNWIARHGRNDITFLKAVQELWFFRPFQEKTKWFFVAWCKFNVDAYIFWCVENRSSSWLPRGFFSSYFPVTTRRSRDAETTVVGMSHGCVQGLKNNLYVFIYLNYHRTTCHSVRINKPIATLSRLYPFRFTETVNYTHSHVRNYCTQMNWHPAHARPAEWENTA